LPDGIQELVALPDDWPALAAVSFEGSRALWSEAPEVACTYGLAL